MATAIVSLVFIAAVAVLALLLRRGAKMRGAASFYQDELWPSPWAAATRAYYALNSMIELAQRSRAQADEDIEKTILPTVYDAEQLAALKEAAAIDRVNQEIVGHPLARKVYDAVTALCNQIRNDLERGKRSVSDARRYLNEQVQVIVSREVRLFQPISDSDIAEMRRVLADDGEFDRQLAAFLSGGAR